MLWLPTTEKQVVPWIEALISMLRTQNPQTLTMRVLMAQMLQFALGGPEAEGHPDDFIY